MAVDATDQRIDEQIEQAQKALIELAESEPERSWTAHELKVRARNGGSSAVMGLALRKLMDEDVFVEGVDLRVRLRP